MKEVTDIYIGITDAHGNVPGREVYRVRAGEAQPPVGTLLAHFAKWSRRKTDRKHADRVVQAIADGVERLWTQPHRQSDEHPTPRAA